ncbi:hypothetical protein N0V91_007592 [Didymella pomorum]|uniref:Uncharacterized protein n=1 Tax=Didymella pomorum TaxID=749634 RepID=A0A9W9D5I6_9PLEO|nr:hypothetical protein N0V91_007592 [Didymella pomorum]
MARTGHSRGRYSPTYRCQHQSTRSLRLTKEYSDGISQALRMSSFGSHHQYSSRYLRKGDAARERRPVDQPRPQYEVIDEFEQVRTQGSTVQQARRERSLDPATASLIQVLGQPINLEGDSIEVVDGYPFVIEGVAHGKNRNKSTKNGRSKGDERR